MNKGIICTIFIFVILGINYANAYNITGSFCTCDSCSDCTNALNDISCNDVSLIQDISDYSETCINDPSNFNNKIFDCQGHTIDGDDSGTDETYGININKKSGNTIKNCVVSDFYTDGIYLNYSEENLILNNTVTSNGDERRGYGIHLFHSKNNLIENNTATENGLAGIRIDENSNNNSISNNYCALNKDYDGIYMTSSSNNKIFSNILTMNDDSGLWISSCSDNYIYNNTITLNGKVESQSGSTSGYGMYLRYSINNTIENNTFCDNLGYDINSDIDSGGNANMKRNNSCDTTSDYADDGKISGCTYNCPVICTCKSCKECNKRLAQNCSIVTLVANITNYDRNGGICINNPENFNNKIFDCNENTIDGDDMEIDYGIYLKEKSNIEIRNCNITDFNYGIYVENSSNFSVVNSTINSNKNYGIFFSSDSSNATLLSNTLCENTNYDIYAYNNTNGTNNTCTIAYNHRDINSTFCSFSCPVDCSCDSCLTCKEKLNIPACGIVTLVSNITNQYGHCITNTDNFNNKVFDCQGNTIDGDASGNDHGIDLNGNVNNNIRNCIITDFAYGIYMDSSSNLSLLNNKILNNSQRGIYSVFSTLILINNSACNNVNFDIYSLNWFSSFGNNNTCDKADGWNDNNRIGCSYCCDGSIPKIYYRDFDSDGYGNLTDNLTICNITPPAGYVTNNTDCDDNNPSINLGATEICNGIDDNCNNQTDENNVCAELCYGHNGNGSCVIKSGENCSCINEALNDNLRCYIEVKLNNSIINWTETCVDNPLNFTNKIFDCQGHIIDGDDSGTLLDPTYGIYLYGRQNNTIKNCIVTDFEFGIYLDGSLNNIISNNTANSNDGDGIQLYASSNNTLANNTANSNSIVGIFLYSASNNIIINNTANSNDNYGIDLRSSSNNTATNNTMNSNAYGIYIYDNSNFNKILNNEISNNTKNGIAVSYRSKFYSGYRSSNNTIENNEILNNEFGIYIEYSSDNNITNNAINSNKYGIYGLDNSNFNQISNNEISNNNETGITISNCYAGSCNFNGNSNNTIEGNEILNNKIGIFSDVSNSTINNNTICNNTNLDFNSSAWLSSSGDNNSCNNSDGWNDANRTGCSYCCDGSIPKIYYRDFDSDGYGNLTNNLTTCNITPLSGYVTNNADCNDNNVSIHQGATEIPNNNIDENCDGSDAINTTCYADADNDNYTNNTNTITTDIGTCPSGYKNITAQDCDDNNASINPGATEICNGIDDNCNNQMDENLQQYIYFGDADNDNYGNLTNNLTTCNITPPVEYVNNTMDCNDNNASINPGATDIPNNKIDENCNGYNNITCYADADNDNYINNTNTVYNDNGTCLITSQDCDDNNASINPGATEICNGIDDNCNNQMDEGINCGQYSCSCSNCSECNEKLNNVSCSIVTLTSPILNHQGTCIDNPENFTDKIFDCQGNIIKGNKTKDSYGILLSKKSNSTIKNCIINGFDYGIYIYASSENKILNNTLNSNNYGIYVSSPNSLSCSGYGYVCIHSSYGDYVYSQIEKRFVLISGDEQSSNNEISNNHACENEILDISLNNENKNFGNNECDKISNNTNTIVFCSKNCSSSELQKTLFLYYCDYDADSYFSKSVSGYCFGNESCIPQNCLLNRGNDCNDNNVSINPNTQEIECNGIDENCDNFDKCGKRIWSSNKYNKEKNTFYSYQGVYVAGTGFNANSKIEIYISPHKNLINLSDFKIKKNITTDENGNFVSLLWNLPAWNELSILYYDIIADENLNGIYEDDEAIDALLFGFSIDPVWASDENGNPKETFCENEAIYVYGKGLPVKNKNITLYFIPDVEISLGSRFCYRGECINISYSVQAEIDENGNFRDVVPGWSNAKSGEYDIIPDLNNNGIFDEIDKKAMDDSYFIGFTVEKKFDFDNNNVLDIFDAVSALENLSDGKIIYNAECSDVNNNGIDLIDIFYLMERIIN